MSRRVGRRLAGGAAVAAAALLTAGCGGSAPSASHTSSSPSSSTTTRAHTTASRPRPRPVRVAGPPLGTRQSVRAYGAQLTVTVLRVAALSHIGSPSLPGTHPVGVTLRIADQAGQTYDSTASGDVSLVLSAGQSEPLEVRSGPCTTPLVDPESMIGSGDVRSACVGFSVPRGARVLGVRFSPHSRPVGTLTWRVSR